MSSELSGINIDQIKKFGIDYANLENSDYNDVIVLKKLKKSMGISIGNAVRRTMLQHCEGYGITSYSIQGVQHEYTSIAGIKEDVQKIITNLSKVVFKGDSEEAKAVLHINKKGEIYAEDIVTSLSVVNKKEYICTVNEDINLYINMAIQKKSGSVVVKLLENNEMYAITPSVICYSPIVNINVEVKNNFDGYEDLYLTIQTNGSVSPRNAFNYAYSLLIEQMQVFNTSEYVHLNNNNVKKNEVKENKMYLNVLNKKIIEFIEKEKLLICLKNMNIQYLGQLVQLSESDLMNQPKMGKKSVEILKTALNNLGLTFDMEVNWEMPAQTVGVIQDVME